MPIVQRKYIIEQLYETHIGITKTFKKSKYIFYRPGMSSDIVHYIEKYVKKI